MCHKSKVRFRPNRSFPSSTEVEAEDYGLCMGVVVPHGTGTNTGTTLLLDFYLSGPESSELKVLIGSLTDEIVRKRSVCYRKR